MTNVNIVTQDRKHLINFYVDFWVTQESEGWVLKGYTSRGEYVMVLGVYDNERQATEVLKYIYENLERGHSVIIMPMMVK